MSTFALLCVALAIELGGPAIDDGRAVGLSISESERGLTQWHLEEHRAGTYRFSSSDGSRLAIYRLPEPDLTYTVIRYLPVSSPPSMVGSVSLLPGAERIAAIRRENGGAIASADLMVSATGDFDSATDTLSEAPPVAAGSSDTAEDPENAGEPPEGDIAVSRGGAVLHVEHRGTGVLVSLTGLRTQSR